MSWFRVHCYKRFARKKGAACCEEEAFLRVLTNVNFKPAVVFCNGAGVQCARGESVITFMGWADIFGWTRARTRRFFRPVLRCRTYRARAGLLPQPHPCARL